MPIDKKNGQPAATTGQPETTNPHQQQQEPPNNSVLQAKELQEVPKQLAQIAEVLDQFRKGQALNATRFPIYSYDTNFHEWASEFKKLAHGHLGMSETEMIGVAIKQIDGAVGKIAKLVAEFEGKDWQSFVEGVNHRVIIIIITLWCKPTPTNRNRGQSSPV